MLIEIPIIDNKFQKVDFSDGTTVCLKLTSSKDNKCLAKLTWKKGTHNLNDFFLELDNSNADDIYIGKINGDELTIGKDTLKFIPRDKMKKPKNVENFSEL